MKNQKKQILLVLLACTAIVNAQLPSPPCDANSTVQVGNLCFTSEELEICSQNLGLLNNTAANNPDINNTCTPRVDDFIQFYDFTIDFIGDFEPNTTCLDFGIKFQNQTFPEGNSGGLNEWEYDETNKQINFTVSHDYFENNCNVTNTTDAYVWKCGMSLEISLAGEIQLTYNFKIQVTLNREVTDNNITVDIVPNVVEGVCCENVLEINTALRFCEDFTCTAPYKSSPLTVQRGEEFYVEHYISDPEWEHYFLEGLEINIGPFSANILGKNHTSTGTVIWKIKSSIALKNQTIESISRIHNTQATVPSTLRFLQASSQTPGDDYKVKGVEFMSVIRGEDSQQQQIETQAKVVYKTEEVIVEGEKSNNTLIYAVIAVGVLTLLSVIGTVVYCQKSKKAPKKYEESQQTEQDLKQVVA